MSILSFLGISGKGEYFGEIALLSGQPRKASVYAVGKATCLETNMDKYAKYQDQGWAVVACDS